jgi:hypothetical protein
MAFLPTGQYLPSGHVSAMQQMQPMQFHPSMLATPMATPQFTTKPLKQPIFPWQAGVTQHDRSESEISDDDDDDDEDSDFDEPPELEPATMHHRTFLQPTQFPTRSRVNSFSGERGRSRSTPRESQCSMYYSCCVQF